jgi:hypothetical protein
MLHAACADGMGDDEVELELNMCVNGGELGG